MNEFLKILEHEFELPLTNPVLVFSLILLIILISPIVLRRLNIPGIIILIVSGIIIGPFGAGLLEQNSAIDLFSTIGLLYIMFIAGLELDMNQFKANRNKSFLFGFFTFIIPLGIGFPVCYYLLNYDFNASFLTASMFATHTLLTYPIVSKLKVSKNEAVAITVGGTILTDTAVLIVLAVIMGNHEGTLDAAFWQRLGISLAIFSAILFFLVPRIAKWFFTSMENEKHSHYIFVLTVVFIAAFLAELAGVEPIIGAFLAGLALNRLIPHSSALMNRIEFIGNALFIPFFLISVGMLVDITVIFSGPTALIVAGTLSLVAVLGKWLASFFTQLTFKYSAAQRKVIFGLSSGHAAATLAVIIVGYNSGIIDENILNGTVILILITSIVATLATQRAATKLKAEVERDLSAEVQKTDSFKNETILLPIANILNFDKLLEFAILIKDKVSPNPISILSVVPNNAEAEVNIARATNKLEDFVSQASAAEAEVTIHATIDQNVAQGIARKSKEIIADLIIFGWPSEKGLMDKLIGKKMERIIAANDKTSFITHFGQPLATHKRIFAIVPSLAELEPGFILWLKKIDILAKELSVPVFINCNETTKKAIQQELKKLKIDTPVTYQLFSDWNDFLILGRDMQEEDIIILVSARKGSRSYQNVLSSIPAKLEKYFFNKSRIIIYP
ncbi:Kef-type K+ transport system, membrane component KefB [Salinimicrobium sediminis]|uniref:Kef-type K+ transport system, membrane component KefB n=1 Tax=Salinimicrobium sediminis TaxID=1343891 RepID=A0A285X2Z5_9FLAO|nr:cation:proton antiporter [Salinimicrobium sediminis]SOC79396.1 Kef-type K+ transport system, membrane component KefB [Salinimicrobium sediminis]